MNRKFFLTTQKPGIGIHFHVEIKSVNCIELLDPEVEALQNALADTLRQLNYPAKTIVFAELPNE
jgi:hypothetical protein